MRKNFCLATLGCVVFLAVFSSCREKGPIDGPVALENEYAYNDVKTKINSVVYTTDDDGFYTVYFSPQDGAGTVEQIKTGNEFVEINVTNPDGKVDFSIDGNSITYKDWTISSSNLSDVSKSELSVEFISDSELRISADIVSADKTLRIDYIGMCTMDEAANEDVLELPFVPFAYYMGEADAGIHNYYMAFTDATHELNSSGQVSLTGEGYLFMVDLYAVLAGENILELPCGEYNLSKTIDEGTFGEQYSWVNYYKPGEEPVFCPFVENKPLTITKDGDVYTVSAHFTDKDGKARVISYKGQIEVKVMGGSGSGDALPQIGHDVEVTGASAQAVYFGNMLQSSTGMMNILIYDEKYDKEEVGGYSVSIVVFSNLFANPKEATLIAGDYSANTSFIYGTWMPAVEIPLSGMVFPLGTYAQLNDGSSMGKFSYGKEGTVTISESGDGWKIEYDLVSKDGYSIKGSYEGPIEVIDESDDKSKDDGTSTLEKDYDMDLSHINTAHYYPSDKVYIQGIGYRPVSTYNVGLQFINIGLEVEADKKEDFKYRTPGGDIIRLELVTEPGKENEITPGTYEVTEQRWPEYIKPGVMMHGILAEGVNSSRWMHQTFQESESGVIYEYMDGHAWIYGGQVTISKVEGKDNWYKFEIDGICVRGHHVRGTWEGPVMDQRNRSMSESVCEPPVSIRRPEETIPMSRVAEEYLNLKTVNQGIKF